MKQKTKKNQKPRRMKKFRSQIISFWLTQTYMPCSLADIGGGKGLVSYILNKSDWNSTVIDPEFQNLPEKYTDLEKKHIKILPESKVEYLVKPWTKELAQENIDKFDVLLGLHAHGVMMNIIDFCAENNKDFILLPCCVIDEPIVKMPDVNWRESLYDYAKSKGLPVKRIQFNFMGKNIAIYTDRNLVKNPNCNTKEVNKYLIEPIRDELWGKETN